MNNLNTTKTISASNLQLKYSTLHFLYFFTTCAINGFFFAFLQDKGLNDSLIGVTVGIAAISSVFISPFLSDIIIKHPKITIKKMITCIYTTSFIIFLYITIFKTSSIILMILFIILYCIVLAVSAFLSAMFVDYADAGILINFGLARGCGSVSYAIAAVIMGWFCSHYSTNTLVIIFIASGIAFLIMLFIIPTVNPNANSNHILTNDSKPKKSSITYRMLTKTYPFFLLFIISYGFVQIGTSCLGVQLLNIVESFGSNITAYGFAIFAMAVSEMPVMAIVPYLLKKISCEKLVAISIVCHLLRNGLIVLSSNMAVLILGLLFQGISFGLFTAAIAYYIANLLLPKYNLQSQTLLFVGTSIATGIGNLLGGTLMDIYGLNGVKVVGILLTILGAILSILTYILKKRAH